MTKPRQKPPTIRIGGVVRTRIRITPPTFCRVRMTGNSKLWTVLVNEWRCYIYPSGSAGSRLYHLHLHGITVKTGVVIGGEQACSNAAERWMQSVGVDTRNLAGRRERS